MADDKRILDAIDGIKDIVEAKHEGLGAKIDAVDSKLEMLNDNVKRNQKSISQLYDLDRDRADEAADIKKDLEPLAKRSKNIFKVVWGVIAAAAVTISTFFITNFLGKGEP